MSQDWKRCIKLLRKSLDKQDLPKYWHRNSPHTYQVWQHAVMLVFCRRYCNSYTDFVEWLSISQLAEYIGLKSIPDEGTLCKEEKRLKKYIERTAAIILLGHLPKRFIAAADMTGFQTKRASPYYIRRIKGSYSRRGYARLETVVWKNCILGWELRLYRKDELAMLRSLWHKIPKKPSTLLYDKKGDCEEHHEWLEKQGIRSIAPPRKGARRGRIRKKLIRSFPKRIYGRRNRVENVNYLLKNRYGDALAAYTIKGRRAEIATKVLAHNLWAITKIYIIITFQ